MKRRTSTIGNLNWFLVGLVCMIAVLGVYNLHSSAATKEPTLYLTQLAWLLCGSGVIVLMLFPDYRLYGSTAYFIFFVVCGFLVAVLLLGHSAGGAQRWLWIGPLRFQPSELAKLATILCLARYFSHRVPEQGYSLTLLFRPLNPSRPLALLGAVVFFWERPGFADPIGTLARSIRERVQVLPDPTLGVQWFKVCLLSLIFLCAIGTGFLVVRWAQAQALLEPWPPKRKNRLLTFISVVALSAVSGIIFQWDEVWLSDPLNAILVGLYEGAAPGNIYGEFKAQILYRGVSLVVVLGYLVASLHNTKTQAPFGDSLIAPVDLLGVPVVLVLVEPDLGTAGVIALIGMSMIMVVGIRARSILVLGVLGIASSVVGWFVVLKDYQKRRILTFLDPEHDIHGAGWNAVQSMIAVGSGQFWGKGHQGGTQTQLSFLPEQHTDFAFSVWAEEMGFSGCVGLLVLYTVLLIVLINVAALARDTHGALIAVGVAAMIFWQFVINIGMVIGMFPVVGLTLPLFSYGGSSLLTILLGIGLVLNVDLRSGRRT
ncbi:MAG: FtsW/RodA/SpoVE family cell cycle protein [Myxococcota bacterium]|nr:FtsW/RodA/SpoVE family cell cycle protein [Myxococcota bacterium]